MQTRSARWDAAIASSHRVITQCDVLFNRATVVSSLNVVGGQITLDRTASILGRLSIELAEPTRVPTVSGGVLTPYGYELAVRRGIAYPDGTTELMALGVFPIQASKTDDTLQTSITALDRSQQVVDARFEDDYSIAAGTNYGTAIAAMVAAGVSGLTYVFTSTGFTTPLLTFTAQSNRWEAAQGMAKSIGCELYFDGLGQCVLRPEPSPSATAVWTVAEGAGGVLVSSSLALDRQGAYNRVIASGGNGSTTTVYRGIATDNNSSSPTYYFGPFGKKPRFYSSPFIASNAQADSAAAAILTAGLGLGRSLDLSAVPNPAVEPGDPIQVTRTLLGINEVHIPDVITIGLGANQAMTMATRARQTAS